MNQNKKNQEKQIENKENVINSSLEIKDKDLDNCELSPWLACVIIKPKYRKQGYGRKLMDFIYHFMSVEKQHITIEWSSTLDGMHLYTKLPYAIRLGNTYKFKMDILNK